MKKSVKENNIFCMYGERLQDNRILEENKLNFQDKKGPMAITWSYSQEDIVSVEDWLVR